jgi:hypothetical protein
MRQLINRMAASVMVYGLTACLAAGFALAQQRMIPISPKAKRADITFNGTPDVLINGQKARLAPGARITDRNNMLALSGSLQGTAKAKYLLEDTTGNVIAIWILTDDEIATPDPEQPR